MQYYIALKTEESKKLLKKGYTIAEISDKLCFNDPNYFIKVFRNFKATKNIGKDFKCMINNNRDYTLINKMLKLDDHIISNKLDVTSYEVANGDYSITIFYQHVVTEEEAKLKEKQIDSLKNSIARREKLLSNQNYVSKAPLELVNQEKEKLEEEKKMLSTLINQ